MTDVRTISEIIEEVVPHYKKKEGPESTHTLVYDSSSETIEPIYFFVLDLMKDFGLEVEKLVDNFTSTPGSAHFSETGIKASRIQDEAMKIMGSVNTVLRSVLNLVHDLKDFKLRLSIYEDLKAKEKKQEATLSLKQIWMDKVDIGKQQSSIKAMALGQAGYQTLIDAFLIANSPKDVDNMDLNERVKRILKPRVAEFNYWIKQSEKELRKRYEIQKNYLKSQVASLKLYSRWVKPYLKAAQELQMKDRKREPELVNMFNTLILELTLLGKSKLDVEKSTASGKLPIDFKERSGKLFGSPRLKAKRDYYSCVLVNLKFRAIPRQGVYIGKSEITFKSYALNDDELKKLDEEIEKSDINDALSLIEGATTESLEQIQKDIDYFLEEPDEEKKKEEQSNPFMALIGAYNKKEKKQDKKEEEKPKPVGELKPDNWVEKTHLRPLVAKTAEEVNFKIFDTYKSAHGMESWT